MSSTAEKRKALLRRTRRRLTRRTSSRRRLQARPCRARRSFNNGGRTCSKVSDKLEALKNLIPAHNGETVNPDQLFKETAEYIVLLRTQVVILQRLVEFYGSSGMNNVVL
ncbi:transcription factor UPBEAT1-like [Alnus glutinosa]|uniref:transcription factor UPBEAT1-like n=1 Tax=Alnus glutinosa TaxID=3517 RepID=UPI002D7A1500|nr:transcription factor UPBEAT1-like [Alnus glutinosa]